MGYGIIRVLLLTSLFWLDMTSRAQSSLIPIPSLEHPKWDDVTDCCNVFTYRQTNYRYWNKAYPKSLRKPKGRSWGRLTRWRTKNRWTNASTVTSKQVCSVRLLPLIWTKTIKSKSVYNIIDSTRILVEHNTLGNKMRSASVRRTTKTLVVSDTSTLLVEWTNGSFDSTLIQRNEHGRVLSERWLSGSDSTMATRSTEFRYDSLTSSVITETVATTPNDSTTRTVQTCLCDADWHPYRCSVTTIGGEPLEYDIFLSSNRRREKKVGRRNGTIQVKQFWRTVPHRDVPGDKLNKR